MATTNSGTTASELFGTTSPVTGSAPTATDGTDGQPIKDLKAITVVVDAGTGVTLSGAGTLNCYILDSKVNAWARMPAGDFSVSTSGVRALAFEVVDVLGPRNAYIKWIPSGVTFSAGSAGVTVYQLGFAADLKGRY